MGNMPSQFTKSDLFRRAHQLCRLNGNDVREKGYRAVFSWALRLAWAERKTGRTQHWTLRPRVDVLKDRLADLEGRPLRQRVADQIAVTRKEIRYLERQAA